MDLQPVDKRATLVPMSTLEDTTTDAAGVVRWKSNGRVPFMSDLAAMGATPEQLAASEPVRSAQVDEAIAAYTKGRKNRSAEERAEEAFEIRAAFGPGVKVVNILTGETVQS